MSQQYINIGATPNDGLGDPIRTAFQKTNENFSELYANSGNGGGNANTGNVTFDNINIIGTGNLHLQPDANNPGAFLDVFLTTGPDIHIAGNGENVIIGSDDGANITVGALGNVTIQANTGTAQTWTFDGNGSLSLPTGAVLGDVYGDGGASLQSPASSYAGINSNNQQQWVEADDFNVYVGVAYGTGQDKQWQFNYNGNLTLPTGGNLVLVGGNIVSNGASPAPSISGFDSISAVTMSASGNISSNYFFGNGSQLTGITASNVDANALVGNTLSANITTSSLTTLGTLGTLSVSGATTSGNIFTNGRISAFGNVVAGNILTSGQVSTSGNIYANNFIGNLSNGASKISIVSSGNVSVGVGPFGTTVFNINTSTGISVLGNIVASGYANATKFTSNPVPYANLSLVAGSRSFINDSNLSASGNFGSVVSGGGANIVPVWSDGTNWYIG